MKKSIGLILFILILTLPIYAQEAIRQLKPKNIAQDEEDYRYFSKGPGNSALTFLIATPLGQVEFPEKRFKAWGNFIELSIPIWTVNSHTFIHLEGGVGMTFIKLSLTQPVTNWTHFFFLFPLHLRGVFAATEKINLEIYLGVLLRPTEYDSRSTTDGGFHRVRSKVLNPDFGMGITYALTPTFFTKLSTGFLHFGLGFGLLL